MTVWIANPYYKIYGFRFFAVMGQKLYVMAVLLIVHISSKRWWLAVKPILIWQHDRLLSMKSVLITARARILYKRVYFIKVNLTILHQIIKTVSVSSRVKNTKRILPQTNLNQKIYPHIDAKGITKVKYITLWFNVCVIPYNNRLLKGWPPCVSRVYRANCTSIQYKRVKVYIL